MVNANSKGTDAPGLFSAEEERPLLEARGLSAGYQGRPVVRDVNVDVRPGEVTALLGPNGAGKTTTMLALVGELPLLGGEVRFDGTQTSAPLHQRARRGLSFVTDQRCVFMEMTVAENLKLGGCNADAALEVFPELRRLVRRKARVLSGGEQQMLAVARAVSRGTRLLLADELSLGLAPLIVRRLFDAVRRAADEQRLGALLVEQYVDQAMRIADRVYVMRQGKVVLSGPPAEVRGRVEEIEASYLSQTSTAG